MQKNPISLMKKPLMTRYLTTLKSYLMKNYISYAKKIKKN